MPGEAFRWSVAEQIARILTQFVSLIALSRLLSPQDFGVNALALAAVSIAGLISELGVGTLIVQKPELDRPVLASAVVTQLSCAVLVFVLLGFWVGPVLAEYFAQPSLAGQVLVMASGQLCASVTMVPLALRSKALDFSVGAKSQIAGSVCGLALGLYLATHGWGGQALAWQYFASAAVAASVVLLLARPRLFPLVSPRLPSRRDAVFCARLQVSSLLDVLHAHLSSVVIARTLSTSDLGSYNRASAMAHFVPSLASSVMGQMALPYFSQAVKGGTLLDALQTLRRGALFLVLPACAAMASLRSELVQVALGAAWVSAASLFGILVMAGSLAPLNLAYRQTLLALGRTHEYMMSELIKKSLGIAFLLAASPFGFVMIAWSQVASAIVAAGVAMFLFNRMAGGQVSGQAGDCLRAVLVSATVYAAGAWLPVTGASAVFGTIAVKVGCVTLAYVLSMAIVAREIVGAVCVRMVGAR